MSVIERNRIRVLGDVGPAMVFSHGFGCDQTMWRYVVPHFEGRYRLILFDHVGSGGSDLSCYDTDKYGSLAGYAADFLEICEELDLSQTIFVGHSVSAMIGALAYIESPKSISKLVMIGPSPCYINDGDYHGGFSRQDIEDMLDFLDSNYLGWSRQMAPLIMGRPDEPQLGDELVEKFCSTDPEIAKHFARVTFLSDHRADLKRIRIPTLILQCAEDLIAPQSVGEYMNGEIPGSELVLLAATGHCPNLSAPEETVAAMKHFLGH